MIVETGYVSAISFINVLNAEYWPPRSARVGRVGSTSALSASQKSDLSRSACCCPVTEIVEMNT